MGPREPGATRSCKRQRGSSPEEAGPCWHLDSRLLASRTVREDTAVGVSHRFVVLCYSNHRSLNADRAKERAGADGGSQPRTQENRGQPLSMSAFPKGDPVTVQFVCVYVFCPFRDSGKMCKEKKNNTF